jgi:Domain of unknown function (DUF4234)
VRDSLAMADDEKYNPYAPPTAAFAGPVAEGRGDYENERRAVILCILLSVITVGFYPAIWLIRRRPFLDRLNASRTLGSGLPLFIIGMHVVAILVAIGGKEVAPASRLVSLAAGITTLIANFRVAAILRSDFARTGRFLGVSSVATFFFSIYYLQYKINQAADTPARVATREKTKA